MKQLSHCFVVLFTLLQPLIAAGHNIDSTFIKDSIIIEEKVNIGYGRQTKSSITGALYTVNQKKLLTTTNPMVANLLPGKFSGVFVQPGTGQPGTDAAVVIRGKATIYNTNPLWVIDGVPVGHRSGELNPDNIETITILKDASLTTIYGSQASNGVIVVTTKKGMPGKLQVDFSAKTGLTFLHSGNVDMMDSKELYDYYNSLGNPDAFKSMSWWNEDLKNRDFDWWGNGVQTGIKQDYHLSLRGGSEKINTYLSGGYYDETGGVKGYDYTRYTAGGNINFSPLKWLTIKPSANFAHTKVFNQQHNIQDMYSNLPWDSPYKASDGSLIDIGSNGEPVWIVQKMNYLYDLQWNYAKSTNDEVSANVDLDIHITDWLSLSAVNNYSIVENTYTYYADPLSISGIYFNGFKRDTSVQIRKIYFNPKLHINKTWVDHHTINAMLAYSWSRGSEDYADATLVDASQNWVKRAYNYNSADWFRQSLIAQVNYNYANRYVAQIIFNRDIFESSYISNKQSGNYFSASAAWNIHEEIFLRNNRFINTLKLRAGYGSTGNLFPAYLVREPEITYSANIGFEISVLDNYFNLSVDVYHRNTANVYLGFATPLPADIFTHNLSSAEIENNGMEFSMTAAIIRRKYLQWTVSANLSLNRNKLKNVYNEKLIFLSQSKIYSSGYDLDTWYLPEWAGVNSINGKPLWYQTAANGERIPSETYDYTDLSIEMGSFNPDFFGGFSTDFSYKNIDMEALFTYSVGGSIYNPSFSKYDSDGTYTYINQINLPKGSVRWQKTGDIATHPQAFYQNYSGSNRPSSRYLQDGSFLKMKSLMIGYTLPVNLGLPSKVRIYASAENLFTITNDYLGIDPEVPTSNGVTTTGQDLFLYPASRTILFGINLFF